MTIKDHLKLLGEMVLISLVAFSLAVTLAILVSPLFYRLSINLSDLDMVSGLTSQNLMENYIEIIKYLLSPGQMDLVMPYFTSSQSGLLHFKEVKTLVQINIWLGIVLLVALIYHLVKMKRPKRKYAHRPYRVIAIGLPLVLLFLVVVMFDKVFYIFHRILFRNDMWIFDPALDPVIDVLPQSFFAVIFVVAILIYEVCVLVIYWIREWKY